MVLYLISASKHKTFDEQTNNIWRANVELVGQLYHSKSKCVSFKTVATRDIVIDKTHTQTLYNFQHYNKASKA